MAENYISQFYTWATGNTITAARLNGNVSNLTDGLSGGAKAINIGKLLMGGFEAIDSSRNATFASIILTGDINTTGAAIDWDLVDNNASALSINAVGKAGLLKIDTTDSAEGISMSGFLTVTDVVTSNSVVVDNVTIDANDISSTSGNLTLTPVAGSAVVIDGAASFDAGVVTGITSLTSTNITVEAITSASGNLTLTPVAGSAVVIDGAASFDAGVVTGITSLTSTNITVTTLTSTNISSAAGTAASPAIYFTGDTDTGMFSPGADTCGWATGGTERIRITSSGSVGIGTTSPSFQLTARTELTGTTHSSNSIIRLESGAGGRTTSIQFSDGVVASYVSAISGDISIGTSTKTITVHGGGGLTVGSPTGGDKGSGTINTAGDIYKNNSAYTNPDYVFEKYFTGKVDKFINNDGAKEYEGIVDINSLKDVLSETFRLPGMDGESKGIFGRSDFVLEKLEEAYIYITQLNKRVSELES